MAENRVVKLTVNLPETLVRDLRAMAEDQGITMTEVLRRAIGTEKFLRDNIKQGSKLVLEDPDKTFRLVHLR